MTEKKKKNPIKSLITLTIVFLITWYLINPEGFKNAFSTKSEDKKEEKIEEKTRTILIYMAPSNLESIHGLASNDLKSIDKYHFDFEHNELIVMAGGTNKWFNSFSKDTKIYHFNKDGEYEVIDDCIGHKNMGESSTLSYFIHYGREHYKSDEYIVFLYGHGYGIDGLLPDEVYNDNLSLKELNAAFTNSYPIVSNNHKIDLFISNSCLMGTIETLENLSYHANYAITTQEIGWINSNYPMLKMFNELKSDEDLVTFSKKYIDRYKESVSSYNDDTTMTLVDLNEILNLYDIVHKFFGSIDVNTYYYEIKSFRSKMHQIGNEEALDEVDLKGIMDQFSRLVPEVTYSEYTKQIEKTIIYHYSNKSYLSGISIWFPYYNPNVRGDYFIGNEWLYDSGTGYRNFVSEFIKKQKKEYGI